MPLKNDRNNTTPENVEQESASTVSEPKTNSQNTTKGTNSRPVRRKVTSTFKPHQDGLLVRWVSTDENGERVDAIQTLFASLAERFDLSDVLNALLIELATTDYGRLARALRRERWLLYDKRSWFYPQGEMPVVGRYVTATRRSLDKSLQMLLQLEKEAKQAGALEPKTEEAETQAPAADSSSQLQPNASSPTSEEQLPQAGSATSASAAPMDERSAADAAARGREAQTSSNDGVSQEQSSTAMSVPLTNEACAEQPMPAVATVAESAPKTSTVEADAERSASELPAAA